MEIIADLIIASFLFMFFFITILKELKFFKGFWHRFPVITHLIPNWSFFAPYPYRVDFYILYRNFSENKAGKWIQLYQYNKMRPIYSFCWNPSRLTLKSIVDICIDLVEISNSLKDMNRICISLPYLHILNYVNNLSKPEMEKIQFMIMTKSKETEPKIVFVSEKHPIK
jgi:hypothetical protein